MLELEIRRNAEGNCLAILGKENEDTSYRIAGPKAWGGSTLITTLKVTEDSLVRFINDYCPEIIEKLKAQP